MTTATNGNKGATGRDLIIQPADKAVMELTGWRETEMRIIKASIMPGATDGELMVFAKRCRQTGLDPFAKQIYALPQGKNQDGSARGYAFAIGIDGFRLIAQRTGEYAGQVGPEWCGDDAVWRDVWLSKEPPAACRVGVYRRGFTAPLWKTVTLSSFGRTYNGKLTGKWLEMPDHMLAIRAESHALKAAFPAEFADIELGDGPPLPAFRGSGTAADLYPAEPEPWKRPVSRDTVVVTETGEVLDQGDPEDELTPVQQLAVDATNRIPLHRTEAAQGAPMIGDVQMKRLHALGKEKNYSHEQLHEWAANVYAVESLTDLTMRQAADMIEQLRSAPVFQE